MFASETTAADEEPAAIVVESPDKLPPFVQLEPDKPPVPWDPDSVDDFKLIDQDGNVVTRDSLVGKPWIANFIFARCTYQCPATCRKIMELNEELRDVDVRFVTITVDPEHDTQEILKRFASIWDADPERWLFLTGEPDEVWQLIRRGFKVSAWENVGTAAVPGMEFAHDNNLIHVDERGKILGRYDSGDLSELTTLKRVLRGKISTPDKHKPATLEAIAALEALKVAKPLERAEADPLAKLPPWAQRLPLTNALLNGLATVLLLVGLTAIKAKRVRLHKQLMLTAFFVSVLFLGCYLLYHYALHHYAGIRGKPFTGSESLRTTYYAILITHVVLAAAVPVLAIVTIYNGLQSKWAQHRRWAKATFPIWLYVSVTGVMIYWMLYRI